MKKGKSNHIRILSVVFSLTFLCAAFNSWEEQLPNIVFYLGTVLGAIITSFFAILFIIVLRNTSASQFTRSVFIVLAYIVCGTAMFAYFYYAINGKADSLHSAAHVHVVIFPFFHIFISCALLLVAVFTVFIASLIKKMNLKL